MEVARRLASTGDITISAAWPANRHRKRATLTARYPPRCSVVVVLHRAASGLVVATQETGGRSRARLASGEARGKEHAARRERRAGRRRQLPRALPAAQPAGQPRRCLLRHDRSGTGPDDQRRRRRMSTTSGDRSATASTPSSCSARSTRSRPSPSSPGSSSARATTGSTARTTARRSRTSTRAGQEDDSRAEAFVIDAGEPAILLGTDTGPEPGRVPAARARRLPDHVARLRRRRPRRAPDRGRVDARGRHGRARRARPLDELRNGFERIRVSFRVKGDAPAGEAARGRRARAGALGRLRHGHQRRARRRGRRP